MRIIQSGYHTFLLQIDYLCVFVAILIYHRIGAHRNKFAVFSSDRTGSGLCAIYSVNFPVIKNYICCFHRQKLSC